MGQTSEEYQDKDAVLQRAPAITILAAETLAGATAGTHAAADSAARGDERVSWFWRVFGGTLLSISALVLITLYQQFTNGINELRGDIGRLNEARGDLVKKDEFNSRLASVWNGLGDAKGAGAGVAGLREKQTLQDQQLKQFADERKEMQREVQLLRERVAKLEGRDAGVKPAAATSRDIPD